jgi:hypothetical protein
MFIYSLLISFIGVCSGLLLIVFGNILKNSDSVLGLLGKDVNDEKIKTHWIKIEPLLRTAGNLFLLTGIGTILAILYFALFTWNTRLF